MSFVVKICAVAFIVAPLLLSGTAEARFTHHCYGLGAAKGRHFELSIDNRKNVVTMVDAGTADQNGTFHTCSISGRIYRQNSKEVSFTRVAGEPCDYNGDKLATIRLERILFERGGDTMPSGRLGGMLMVDTYGSGPDNMDQYQCVMPFTPVAIR